MRTRLYSTVDQNYKPVLFTEEQLTNPGLQTLQQLLNAIAPSNGLTFWGFILALTLWVISACDAVQITGLGYLISALAEPVDNQPVPPHWLFPIDGFTATSFQTAMLASIVYAGMLVGGLFSSPLERYNGSRPALLLCCLSSFLAHIGSSMAPNFVTLTICQAIIGLSLGVRVPIVYSNMAQLFPNQHVGFIITTASVVWVLGSMYASTMGWLTLGSIWNQSWRVYMLVLTIPSLISLIMAIPWVYETLHFGVFMQFRPTPALDLLKVHYGKVFSRSLKHFWYNIFCCCGACCCGKRIGKNKLTQSLANRYGSVSDQYYDSQYPDTNSVADSNYSYTQHHDIPSSASPSRPVKQQPIAQSAYDTHSGIPHNNNNNDISNASPNHRFGNGPQYQSNSIDPNDPHNDPFVQEYERKRKPSMFQESGIGLAGTPLQGKAFDHEQFLPEELRQQLMMGDHTFHNSSRINFTSANTVYSNETDSRASSVPDPSYVFQTGGINHSGRDDDGRGHTDDLLLETVPRGVYLHSQQQQLAILDDHYLSTNYIPSGRNQTEALTSQLDQRDMSGLGLKLINLNSSKGNDGTADWNIDIDNPASVEELFDFLQKQLLYYTAKLKFEKQQTLDQSQQIEHLSPQHAQITSSPSQTSPLNNNQQNSFSKQSQYDDARNSTVLMTLDYTDFRADSSLSQSQSTLVPVDESPSKLASSSLTSSQQTLLLIILCAVWFIVSFQAAGFSSFLPLLWDRVFPDQSNDMKYIVSLIFSAVQLPAGLMSMFFISRVFPPRLLLGASVISLTAMVVVTVVFKAQLVLATIFVFVCQFGLSTSWCAINFVALQYFPDDKKILYYAVQASLGKLGAFAAQYVFASLLENTLLLMIIVTILSTIVVLLCIWFNYTVRNATTSH